MQKNVTFDNETTMAIYYNGKYLKQCEFDFESKCECRFNNVEPIVVDKFLHACFKLEKNVEPTSELNFFGGTKLFDLQMFGRLEVV